MNGEKQRHDGNGKSPEGDPRAFERRAAGGDADGQQQSRQGRRDDWKDEGQLSRRAVAIDLALDVPVNGHARWQDTIRPSAQDNIGKDQNGQSK